MNQKNMVWLFPLTGAVTGIVMYAFYVICLRCHFGAAGIALIGAVIPVLLNGGLPLYGFYKTTEVLAGRLWRKGRGDEADGRKSFCALTVTVSYYMLYAGGLVLIEKERQLLLLAAGYGISRILAVMAFLWFPAAGTEKDVLFRGTDAYRKTLRIIFSVILALCFFTCVLISPIMGVLASLLSMWVWTYCYYMCKKTFGGITKDAAGYFLTLCELAAVLFIGIFGRI